MINSRISGSTLQETIIALTVVLICFSAAITVFVNVLNSERAWTNLNSELLIKKISMQTKLQKTFFDEWIEDGEYQIEKTITNYKGKKNIVQLHLKIFMGENKLIKQHRELIVDYDETNEKADD